MERQGVTRWWMIDDGCDLNRWLLAGQIISSEGGVIRRRRSEDYYSIILCLWEACGNCRRNSYSWIQVSHTLFLCLSVCVAKMCLKNRKQKEGRGFGYISSSLTLNPMGTVCGYVFTCVYLAAWCCSEFSLDRGGFTPLGKTVQAERSDKVTSAVLSERTHINTIPLTRSHYVLMPWVQYRQE